MHLYRFNKFNYFRFPIKECDLFSIKNDCRKIPKTKNHRRRKMISYCYLHAVVGGFFLHGAINGLSGTQHFMVINLRVFMAIPRIILIVICRIK